MTIRVTCPCCKRLISVERPGHYTCKVCKTVMRIEGRVQDASLQFPFACSEPIPMMDCAGTLAALKSRYEEMFWRFARATT